VQTDIPLKRLTTLRAFDLLPLLNITEAAVVAVETLELQASATRLDNVLRIQSAGGQEYLHVIEWQGYTDPFVLWRLAGYLAWLGQNGRAKTVVGTVIYLTPAADVGNSLRQTVDGRDLLVWEIPAVRLWELDAVDTAQRGNVGLAVLSPLMRGASAELVEQVVTQVLSHAPLVQQADLLSILGVFAEPLIDTERFVGLVGKEKLMSSDLITYLVDEKVAEVERRYAEAERRHAEELEQKLAAVLRTLHDAVEDTVILRFPNTPAVLVRKLRSVSDLEQLASLRRKVLEAPDQAAVEALLATLAPVA
jgi:predicted transposase YdaD